MFAENGEHTHIPQKLVRQRKDFDVAARKQLNIVAPNRITLPHYEELVRRRFP